MKFTTLAAVAATVGAVAAHPHRHSHAHFHEKKAAALIDSAVVERSSVSKIVYVLWDGTQITKAEALEGLKNGTFILADDGAIAPAPTAPKPKKGKGSIDVHTPVMNANLGGSFNMATVGDAEDFPDGQLDCSEFPSKYGAMALDYVGLNGWSGIQRPGSSLAAGFNDIMTITSEILGSGAPIEGAFYSYACAPGLQKTQWPQMQGATGQSIGGLQCKGGKLHLSNPAVKKLCSKGTEAVKVRVKNTMSKGAAICRTDYPGTENMVIPIDSKPGSTLPVTCPDENYYNWEGKLTSAQYYVNPAGLSVEDACQWGKEGDIFGNFAPTNLGVGFTDGLAWLSIFQNLPTQSQKLDYTVELVGDNLSDKCRYSNGQYCSGANYETCNDTGCTVSVPSGSATFVLS